MGCEFWNMSTQSTSQPHSIFGYTPFPRLHLEDPSPFNHNSFEDSITWISLPIIVIPSFSSRQLDFSISALLNQLWLIHHLCSNLQNSVDNLACCHLFFCSLVLYKGTKLYTLYLFIVIEGILGWNKIPISDPSMHLQIFFLCVLKSQVVYKYYLH